MGREYALLEEEKRALSQISENRKVEAPKSLIFHEPIFRFCLQKAILRQSRHVCPARLRRHGPSLEERRRGWALCRIGGGRHVSGVSCPTRSSRTGSTDGTLAAGSRTL